MEIEEQSAQQEQPDYDEAPRRLWLVFIGIGVFILAFQLVVWLTLVHYLDDWQRRGQFGDMFGAANATFSGLALAGVIIAILLQKRELQYQRRELCFTRRELQRAATAHEASSRLLSQQVEVTRRSLEAHTRPVWDLVVRKFTEDNGKCYITVTNVGAPVHSVAAKFSDSDFSCTLATPTFAQGGVAQLEVYLPVDSGEPQHPKTFSLQYFDSLDIEHKEYFRLSFKPLGITRFGMGI